MTRVGKLATVLVLAALGLGVSTTAMVVARATFLERLRAALAARGIESVVIR